MKDVRSELKNAIIKKAKGFDTSETVEEYQGEDGKMVLTKKKVTKKYVPPDTQAAKMLMDMDDERKSPREMTDEELEKEKIRLLKLIKEMEDENRKN